MTSELVQNLCALIEHTTGITLRGATPQRLVAFARRRCERLGINEPLDYVRWVGQADGHRELEAIINLVTNGLTAFWREHEQLDAVRLAYHDLSRQHGNRLSVWSVGCSTGEEPYTLAMIGQEAQISCSILGSDINTDSLTIARHAVYGDWSLRRLSPERRRKYFTLNHESRWSINDDLRRHVRFQHHNLLDPPNTSPNGRGWDIILCRNVFIYLNDDAILDALDNFAEVLNPNGYLMLGASEQYLGEKLGWRSPFRQAKHGEGYVFRLQSTPPGKTMHGVPALSRESLTRHHNLEEETVDFDAHNQVTQLLEHAITHIDEHNMASAMACCEAALGHDPFAPDASYLLALLWRTLGEHQRAIDAFKQVLFLNPLHWMGAFELAKLYDISGASTRARIAYEQAIEGIEHHAELTLSPPLATLISTTYDAHRQDCLVEARKALAAL